MASLSRRHAIRIGRQLLLAMLSALPGAAGAQAPDDLRPAVSDLRDHVVCSQEAARRLLSFDEAATCAAAYMKVKLSFVPGMGLDEFNGLSPAERAAVNLLAYERYLDWSSRNAAEIAALRAAAPSISARATE